MKRLFVLILLTNLSINVSAQERVLSIDPIYQQTHVWCWVSVGEMIFRYYDICCINPAGNYQCGIIALLSPACNINCFNCQIPAKDITVIMNMLANYPLFASQVCGSKKMKISSVMRNSAMSQSGIIVEIDNERPVIAGISPSGNWGFEPYHVALIVGYEYDDGDFYLIVNDPFPYELSDPYISHRGALIEKGQYRILYNDFIRLNWTKSLYLIR